MDVFRIRLEEGQTVSHEIKPSRAAWLHVAEGALTLNGAELATGDGASTEASGVLTMKANKLTEALLFDIA